MTIKLAEPPQQTNCTRGNTGRGKRLGTGLTSNHATGSNVVRQKLVRFDLTQPAVVSSSPVGTAHLTMESCA